MSNLKLYWRERGRVWYWWYMCRLPLTDCFRATRENMHGFEYFYYHDCVEPHPKKRLRIFKSRTTRKLQKILKDQDEKN